MKKFISIIALACIVTSAYAADAPFNPKKVKDATKDQVTRVEPLSWWTGMKTPLQLLVQGQNISAAEVSIEGGAGVAVTAVHKAESPNYVFVDVAEGSMCPQTCHDYDGDYARHSSDLCR